MTITSTITAYDGILVAHDGSSGSNAAVLTAIRCAPAFGPRIHVVRVWTLGSAPAITFLEPGHVSYEDFEQAVLGELERDVASIRHDHPQVDISVSVVHGGATEKLIEASHHVDMIVVGERGRGGFAGLMLGSVSEQVVRHAACRVLVNR